VAGGAFQAMRRLTPNEVGKIGEDAVRVVHDIGKKSKISINNRIRIPDGITREFVNEVKNVQSLSYTQQLRDYFDYAREADLVLRLFVRSDTELSGPLLEAIQKGDIILEIIPGT